MLKQVLAFVVVVLVVVVAVVVVFVVVAVVCCFSGHTTTALAVLKVVMHLAVKLVVFPSKSKHCDFADEKIGEINIIDYGEEKQKYGLRYRLRVLKYGYLSSGLGACKFVSHDFRAIQVPRAVSPKLTGIRC